MHVPSFSSGCEIAQFVVRHAVDNDNGLIETTATQRMQPPPYTVWPLATAHPVPSEHRKTFVVTHRPLFAHHTGLWSSPILWRIDESSREPGRLQDHTRVHAPKPLPNMSLDDQARAIRARER
jgi:hypothetical protein